MTKVNNNNFISSFCIRNLDSLPEPAIGLYEIYRRQISVIQYATGPNPACVGFGPDYYLIRFILLLYG